AERAAALLVVSCTGHGHALLLRTGGTAERVAESARVPTLVVHDAAPFEEWATRRRPLRVVLGLGDGAADEAAVGWVGRLRRGGACDVDAVSIYDPVEAPHRYGLQRIGSVLDPDPRVERLIQAEIDASLAKLEGTGAVSSRIVAAPGRRGDHLLEVAAKEQADLIVVGAHPKGWLKRLSSVSSVTLHWRNTSVACIPA
ncbi:MAG: universal stress protein, partial [Myxococcales bacterium]